MTNFFGGPPPSRNRGVFELIEKKQESFAFTIMSDLHLDSPTVIMYFFSKYYIVLTDSFIDFEKTTSLVRRV